MNARAKRLYELAAKTEWKQVADPETGVIPLLAQLAVLVDAATRPEPKAAKPVPGLGEKPPLAPGQVLTALRARVGHIVITEPVDKRWFGWMGGVLKGIHGLVEADLDLVLDWILAGALTGWPGGAPGLHTVAKWFPAWVGRAREWDKRGRQELRGGHQVGAAPESTPESMWEAFKAQG